MGLKRKARSKKSKQSKKSKWIIGRYRLKVDWLS
jgi:hypothetical protein